MIGNKPKQNIVIENTTLKYANKANILGLNFKSNNFFKTQVEENIKMENLEIKKLYKFRYLKRNNSYD